MVWESDIPGATPEHPHVIIVTGRLQQLKVESSSEPPHRCFSAGDVAVSPAQPCEASGGGAGRVCGRFRTIAPRTCVRTGAARGPCGERTYDGWSPASDATDATAGDTILLGCDKNRTAPELSGIGTRTAKCLLRIFAEQPPAVASAQSVASDDDVSPAAATPPVRTIADASDGPAGRPNSGGAGRLRRAAELPRSELLQEPPDRSPTP